MVESTEEELGEELTAVDAEPEKEITEELEKQVVQETEKVVIVEATEESVTKVEGLKDEKLMKEPVTIIESEIKQLKVQEREVRA